MRRASVRVTEELLASAIESERQNRIDEAKILYSAVLERDPVNFFALHGLGVVFCRQGQLEEAERWISKAVARDPRSAPAHNNLGTVLHALRRTELAIRHYREAVAISPGFADAQNNLAACLMQTGALLQARSHLEAALRAQPDHRDAHNNLGALLQRLGQQSESIAHFEAALKANPDYPEALNNYGTALIELGEHQKGLDHCLRAAQLKPEFAEAHNSIGNALMRLGRPVEAVAYFEKAIALRAGFVEAYNNLGTALDAAGRLREAIACLKQTIKLDPNYAGAFGNLGTILLRYGRLDDARRAFAHAVELEPQNAQLLLNLAELKQFSAGDPHIEAMEQLANGPMAGQEEQQVSLHFALSKAYADLRDHDNAARHMVKANSLKRRQILYDERGALDELIQAETLFTQELMQRFAGQGNASDVPIFIVGMPRSGTTLIEQVLASHGRVFGADELNYFADLTVELPRRMGTTGDYPIYAPMMTPEWLRALGDAYMSRLRALAPDALRITDKMPANFRFVGLIHLALPNARIIHACRDPIDTCLSCYSIRFSNGQAFSYDLKELGRLYKGYQRLMRHWHSVLPPGVMIDVHYEELVADFEPGARRILAHCGLEWSPACLQFHRTDRPVRTASASQVRQPLYATAVGRWRPYAKMLQPLLEELQRPD